MFQLRVLGGFALYGSSGSAPLPRPQRRGDAVLAVLAVCGSRGCTRERLVGLLWPDSNEARAGQGLRDAIYAIRRALHPSAVPAGGRLLHLDADVVVSDVVTFTQALAAGRHEEAVRAYAGPLLEGFHVDEAPEFEHWMDGERARLSREYAEALRSLATTAERGEAWHEAVGWWGRAVQHDPLNSHLVLQYVRALAAIGDRANAIKAAEVHARRLREELDLEPDREVLAKIDLIRRGQVPTPSRPELAPTPAAAVELPRMADESLGRHAPESPPSGVTPPIVRETTVPERAPRRVLWALGVAAVLVVAGAFGVGRWVSTRARGPRYPRTAIAVLPFRNLSADSSHAYFAGGLHDELLTQLARVASLRSVGRTSVGEYLESAKPLRQIAEELEVGSVVEASVQVVGNRLRVIVQLVDPVTQADLWTERYDRILDSAFTVESEIAHRIVAAVGATLTTGEAGAISVAPTENSLAYEFYLQGLEYSRRPGLLRQNFESAQRLYERALALDSAFAQAHAALSLVHFAMHDLRYDPSPTRLGLERREADLALRLAPELPRAHLVAGLMRISAGDLRGAQENLEDGLRLAPTDAELWYWLANVERGLGHWDGATVAYGQARRLDPRNANLFHGMGDTFHRLHRYREAIEAYRREVALAPDVAQARLSLAWSYVLWTGELDTLRGVLRGLPLDADPGMGGHGVWRDRLELLAMERRPDSILSLLRVHSLAVRPSPQATLLRTLWTARAHTLQGDTAAARTAYGTAAAILDAQERASPADGDVHGTRGLVLAWLGRRAEALGEAQWLARSDAYRADADVAAVRAEILARLGETEAALADVERALASPSTVTAPLLRLLPEWDPIRSDPRFEALLLKYADPLVRSD